MCGARIARPKAAKGLGLPRVHILCSLVGTGAGEPSDHLRTGMKKIVTGSVSLPSCARIGDPGRFVSFCGTGIAMPWIARVCRRRGSR